MVNLILPVGISASGKSYLGTLFESKGFIVICPDDIRKELTGNISDQSENARVFQLANSRTLRNLKKENNVFFSATNLGIKNLEKSINIYTTMVPQPFHITIIFLKDSLDISLCRKRVKQDLDNGLDRSNTYDDESIIKRQYVKFLDSYRRKDELKSEYVSVFTFNGSNFMDLFKEINCET